MIRSNCITVSYSTCTQYLRGSESAGGGPLRGSAHLLVGVNATVPFHTTVTHARLRGTSPLFSSVHLIIAVDIMVMLPRSRFEMKVVVAVYMHVVRRAGDGVVVWRYEW